MIDVMWKAMGADPHEGYESEVPAGYDVPEAA
jgi:hypothetical protein